MNHLHKSYWSVWQCKSLHWLSPTMTPNLLRIQCTLKLHPQADLLFWMQGEHVTDMYFVASAYNGKHLSDFHEPHILIKDSDENMTLCEYLAGVSHFISVVLQKGHAKRVSFWQSSEPRESKTVIDLSKGLYLIGRCKVHLGYGSGECDAILEKGCVNSQDVMSATCWSVTQVLNQFVHDKIHTSTETK